MRGGHSEQSDHAVRVTLGNMVRRASGPNLASLTGPAPTPVAMRRRTEALMMKQTGTARIGSLFRSESMTLVRLYFDRNAAHFTIDELGDLGLCQFKDLNDTQSPFQRTFSNHVRRCDEMLRILRYLREQVEETDGLSLAPNLKQPAADALRLDDLESHLQSLERTLLEMNSNSDALKAQFKQTCELRAVLEKSARFFHDEAEVRDSLLSDKSRVANGLPGLGSGFGGARVSSPLFRGQSSQSEPLDGEGLRGDSVHLDIWNSSAGDEAPLLFDTGPSALLNGDDGLSNGRSSGRAGSLSFITGTIHRDKKTSFERILFRATHGNCILRFSDSDIDLADVEPLGTASRTTGNSMETGNVKAVFMTFFASAAVREKVAKICDAFEVNRFTIPEDHQTQLLALSQSQSRISDLSSVLSITNEQLKQSLVDVAANLTSWEHKVKREMGTFHILNLLNYDTSNRLFIAEAWCPESAQDEVRSALEIGRRRANAQVPSIMEIRHPEVSEILPTYYKTNKFTSVFQSIVESYGVAKYQEVNPAPYTIVTFPFLFAVMFGDIGHGILMACFAAYLVHNETRLQSIRKKMDEITQICYDGRYIILLMGIFSVFTGFIYNEFFAVPLDLFGTRWKYTTASSMACGIDNCLAPAQALPPLRPYPLGFDPIWKTSRTGLVFFNSYKMKLSIVLGVMQMVMGICLSYSNARFFKKSVDILYVFIPQMIFMNAIFGYLVFLILLKWFTDFNSVQCSNDPNCFPPDLKSVLIAMIMSPGKLPPGTPLYRGQAQVQVVLLLAAIVAVPWMLLPKPLILRARHQKRRGYDLVPDDNAAVESGPAAPKSRSSPPFDFSEVFVHQMIHTIEFVLGAVSNTASYLRLWALSLAHAELSNVFLEKLLFGSVATGNPFLMLIGFFMWISMTLGVLMGMESLSAFLHALRLHWVEFQNKFYLMHGDGSKFLPFDHNGGDE
jgi:V-type H+-transporting ATPase subunit a